MADCPQPDPADVPGAFGAEWPELSDEAMRIIVDDFVAAAVALGGTTSLLARDLADRWYPRSRCLREAAVGILNRLLEVLPDPSVNRAMSDVVFMTTPAPLVPLVDMAMFVPLPTGERSVVLISPTFDELALRDDFAACRILLIVAHEVLGHALQHRALLSVGAADTWKHLDRELLEGWAVLAEGTLGALGKSERLLADLYRAKRLLPMVQRAVAPSTWIDIRVRIEEAWPGFFESQATRVLRHAVGTHSRGLVRAERQLETSTSASMMESAVLLDPWRGPDSRM